jgi:hypothetical protein
MDDIKMDNSFSFFLYFQRWRRRNQKRKKKHLWGSSSVIATGGFSSTDFRFQEKLYIINGVSMTHVHTRMEMVGKEEKKNQTIDRICYFAGLYRTSAETVLQIAI